MIIGHGAGEHITAWRGGGVAVPLPALTTTMDRGDDRDGFDGRPRQRGEPRRDRANESGRKTWKGTDFDGDDVGPQQQVAHSRAPISQALPDSVGQGATFSSLSPRSRVKPTDSDYVKMAKRGGRQDLLDYTEEAQAEQCSKPYEWPAWMGDAPAPERMGRDRQQPLATLQETQQTQWFRHHDYPDTPTATEMELRRSYQSKPPFSLEDQKHKWERHADPVLRKPPGRSRQFPQQNHGNVAGPGDEDIMAAATRRHRIKQSGREQGRREPGMLDKSLSSVMGRAAGSNKYSRQKQRSEPSQTDMQHLLSMGYQKDYMEKQASEHAAKEAKLRAELAQKKELLKRPSNLANAREQQTRSRLAPGAEEKPFKLSRFDKVSSKVSTWRSPTEDYSYDGSHGNRGSEPNETSLSPRSS